MRRGEIIIHVILLMLFVGLILTCKKLPKEMFVKTGQATDITQTSANVSGEIIDIGEGAIQYGHCYSKTSAPTINNNKTQLGRPAGPKVFTSSLKGLDPGTKYYVKAYITDGNEVIYGKEVTFSTISCNTPTANTDAAANVTTTTATLNGTVNANGFSTIVTFEYGLTTSYGSEVTTTQSPVTGSSNTAVSAGLTGLTPGTTYHYRVKAVNCGETVYGSDQTFSTSITDFEGNVYKTIQIGSQLWMAENLKTTKYKDGSSIPSVTGTTEWSNLTTPAYCWYNNDKTTYGNVYGALYNWYVVNTGKLCPTNWHVPSNAEWITLISFLGGESIAGGKVKSTGTLFWNSPNTGASNESGFSALGGGFRGIDGKFFNILIDSYWWSMTEVSSTIAVGKYVNYLSSSFFSYDSGKRNGFYIRCIKD